MKAVLQEKKEKKRKEEIHSFKWGLCGNAAGLLLHRAGERGREGKKTWAIWQKKLCLAQEKRKNSGEGKQKLRRSRI